MVKKRKNEYWREREKVAIASQKARGKRLKDEVQDLYAYHFKAIETEIEGFLHRYAENNAIDTVEARKRVSDFDVKAFETKAKKYVAEKNFSSKANAELRLYNLKMKMRADELLQYQLDLEMLALSEGERQLTERFLNETYVQELNRQAGLLGHAVPSPQRIGQLARASLRANFHGANWSDKIWKRQGHLREILQRDIESMLLRGQHPTKIIGKLRHEFATSVYEAKRLAVTEMARMSTEAQRAAFEEYGYKVYEFIAEPSACPICAGLDGKFFKVSKMRVGENASPMHPHCHCSTGAVEREGKFVEKAIETAYNKSMDALDLMAKSQSFVVGNDIRVKAKRVQGVAYDFWVQDNTKKIRDTVANVQSVLERLDGYQIPRIVFLKKSRLPGFAGYDYKQDILFVSDALHSEKQFAAVLADNYFAARNIKDTLIHELTHKKHWDSAKVFYNLNKKRYNTLEQAMLELNSPLMSYVKNQHSQNKMYLYDISINALAAFEKNNINELVAEIGVLGDRVLDLILLEKVKEVLIWK